jgi:hypothetical protein
MAIKTFTTGEVLTAADTNTYLANSGLVYVKSQTIGNAVTSVVVPSAFSADFDDYLVTIDGGVCTGNAGLSMQLGAKTTNYRHVLNYASYNNTPASLGTTTATSFTYTATASATGLSGYINFITPFLATKNTFVHSSWCSQSEAGSFIGQTTDAVSYTAFTLFVGSGLNITGGIITVYGYRKA